MKPEKLREILERVAGKEISVERGIDLLRNLPFEDIGTARLDHHRELRIGVPEIVFGEGKSLSEIVRIVRRMVDRMGSVLVSRVDSDKGTELVKEFPDGVYHSESRLFFLRQDRSFYPQEVKGETTRGLIFVVAAGTSDIPVAEEARLTAEHLGNRVDRLYDVGIAGLHRLLSEMDRLREASVIIAIAGMEGALPSVLAGLVGSPIIAVPTSVGYGTGLKGFAALLAMLNSCVPGVMTVNVDNGIGAAVAAHLIVRCRDRQPPKMGEGGMSHEPI